MTDIDHSMLVSRTPETLPFWQAADEGRLVLPFCEGCGQHHWYPRAFCPHCHGQTLRWTHSSGLGVIHSMAVLHRSSPLEAAAVVRLDEGVCVYTIVRLPDAADLSIGDRVQGIFEPVSSARKALIFRQVENSGDDPGCTR